MNYLVMYSGGAASWAAAKRTVEFAGRENVRLLFADTLTEDPDTYRFLEDSRVEMGCELVRIADGRDIWEVFVDERMIGYSMKDPCSRILKRRLMDRWRQEHCSPDSTVLVFGLDWSERTRIDGSPRSMGLRSLMAEMGWRTSFPMDERPYMTKAEMLDWMRSCGLRPPRLYDLGFEHNNCGGFCIKAGHGQMRHLLRVLPDVYRHHEEREAAALAAIGPPASPFLRVRKGGRDVRITLREFREQHEAFPLLDDRDGWGCGGGCAVDYGPEPD